jgi:hypothetical protein
MGGFVERTAKEKEYVPAAADALVAMVSGCAAAVAVAPFLMCVDRGVVAAAAGTAPGGSLFRAIASVAGEFVTKPKIAFTSPALWMVAGVYGGTYFAKNVSDVVIERTGVGGSPIAQAGKFAVVTSTNMGGSILKDAAFAKLFGAGAAATGAPPVVPLASYALFALRDCLTIGGAFFVPDVMRDALVASGNVRDAAAGAAAQLASPPLMQVVCTPMHLLALNFVNAPGATAAARMAVMKKSTPAALLARSLRMLPAYGVGGILNTSLTLQGRRAVAEHFLKRRDGWASEKVKRAWGARLGASVLGAKGTKGSGGGDDAKAKRRGARFALLSRAHVEARTRSAPPPAAAAATTTTTTLGRFRKVTGGGAKVKGGDGRARRRFAIGRFGTARGGDKAATAAAA